MAAAIALTLLTWLAAVAVTLRLQLDGRAERILAAVLVWNGVVLLPVYVLGELGVLYAGTVAAASILLSLALLLVAGRERLRALPRALAEPLTLARDAIFMIRDNPLVGGGAGFCIVLELWTVAMAYLAPAWRSWDPIWYHEPIIGYAIQNHGLGWSDAPFTIAQMTNTMTRSCELTGLWFVIFAGRRLVDLANTLYHPALVLAVFICVRRMTRSRAAAAGWAVVIGLVPAFVVQLQSSYIDVQASALGLAALAFATRPRLRRAEAALAWLALALAVGAKLYNAIPAAIIGLVLLVRGERRVSVAGVVLAAAVASTTMIPNLVHTGNPFYPIPLHVPALHLDLQGLHTAAGKKGFQTHILGYIYSVPGTDAKWEGYYYPYYLPPHDKQEFLPPYNYGYIVPWILVPLGALGVAAAFARRRWRSEWGLWVAIGTASVSFVAMMVPLYARYQAFPMTALAMALARLLDRWPRASAWLAGAAAVVASCTFAAQTRVQIVQPPRALRMLLTDYPAREVTPSFGAPVEKETGLLRERELGPGAILVYGDDVSQPAPLWNNDFSNKIVYVPFGADYLARAEALGATWVFAGENAARARIQLATAYDRWEYLGRLFVFSDWRPDGAVWRRRQPGRAP